MSKPHSPGFRVPVPTVCATAACIPLPFRKPAASGADTANISLLAGQARWWHLTVRENFDLFISAGTPEL